MNTTAAVGRIVLRSLRVFPGLRAFHNKGGALRAPTYFSKKHEWVDINSDSDVAVIGISNYAQSSLGDIVYVQLPDPQTTVEVGRECGALESVKAASEIYSPVSGTVLEKNEAAEEAPGLINSSPQEDGWLFKIEVAQSVKDELKDLLSPEEYEKYIQSQQEDH